MSEHWTIVENKKSVAICGQQGKIIARVQGEEGSHADDLAIAQEIVRLHERDEIQFLKSCIDAQRARADKAVKRANLVAKTLMEIGGLLGEQWAGLDREAYSEDPNEVLAGKMLDAIDELDHKLPKWWEEEG